jgi:acyl dehydratase
VTARTLIRAFAQSEFDAFAALSGDHNPIHVDPAFAAANGFGATVAHGAMLCATLQALGEAMLCEAGRDPGEAGWHLVESAAMFPAPTFADQDMVLSGTLLPATAETAAGAVDLALDMSRAVDAVVTCTLRLRFAPVRPPAAADTPAWLLDPQGAADRPLRLEAGAALSRAFTPREAYALAVLAGGQVRDGQTPEALGLGMFSTLLGMELPGRGTNYLKQATRFHAAARLGETLRAGVRVTRLRPETRLVDLETLLFSESAGLVASGRALVSARDVPGAFA